MIPRGGPNADMIKLQQQIMQNSMGIQEYIGDLNSWTSDIKQKEKKTVYQAKGKEPTVSNWQTETVCA